MSKVYNGAEGLAPDANERSEGKPGASYIWALVIGSMIERVKLDIRLAMTYL
jgi:hypothetical protein